MRVSDRYRTALVTGAGSGLGAAFTDMLLAEGVHVWGTSRDPSRLRPLEGFSPLALDLADTHSIDLAWRTAEKASGSGIELLVNNAASAVFSQFGDQPFETWQEQIDVVLLGPARLAHHALAAMRARGRGCIVNVSSLVVEFPIPFMSAYNAGKAALSMLTANLDLEARGTGVTVIDFMPGDHRTAFNRSMAENPAHAASDPDAARVWERLEHLMTHGPAPERAAADLRGALVRGRSGVVRSGSFFQARLAPFLQRFATARLSADVQRRYFRLRRR